MAASSGAPTVCPRCTSPKVVHTVTLRKLMLEVWHCNDCFTRFTREINDRRRQPS